MLFCIIILIGRTAFILNVEVFLLLRHFVVKCHIWNSTRSPWWFMPWGMASFGNFSSFVEYWVCRRCFGYFGPDIGYIWRWDQLRWSFSYKNSSKTNSRFGKQHIGNGTINWWWIWVTGGNSKMFATCVQQEVEWVAFNMKEKGYECSDIK